MSLRLLQILVAREDCDEVLAVLDEHGAPPRWTGEVADGRVTIDVVMRASGNEPVLDALQSRFHGDERFRLLFIPLEATVPRIEEEDEQKDEEQDEEQDGEEDQDGEESGNEGEGEGGGEREDEGDRTEEASPAGGRGLAEHAPWHPSGAGDGTERGPSGTADSDDEKPKRIPERINREELHADIAELSRTSSYFLIMSALSSVVATAGLLLGDGAVIIGAMVIAPLIGPSMGTAFATTLGDLGFGWRTLKASVWGALAAFVVAFLAGLALDVDPTGTEIIGRTRLTYEHMALALAAGAAGALAITRGTGAGLVGVMVAVALLPPLATAGLLLGDGHLGPGAGALTLMVGNIVSVNLAATVTFLAQGVRPNTWWEEGIRTRAVWVASSLWGGMLLILAAIVWFAWGGEPPSINP